MGYCEWCRGRQQPAEAIIDGIDGKEMKTDGNDDAEGTERKRDEEKKKKRKRKEEEEEGEVDEVGKGRSEMRCT